jgi:hypothetical protein
LSTNIRSAGCNLTYHCFGIYKFRIFYSRLQFLARREPDIQVLNITGAYFLFGIARLAVASQVERLPIAQLYAVAVQQQTQAVEGGFVGNLFRYFLSFLRFG